jgi:hypothetical protein
VLRQLLLRAQPSVLQDRHRAFLRGEQYNVLREHFVPKRSDLLR